MYVCNTLTVLMVSRLMSKSRPILYITAEQQYLLFLYRCFPTMFQMDRTALHYANLFFEEDCISRLLIKHGAKQSAMDTVSTYSADI